MPQDTLYNALQFGEQTHTEYSFQILEQVVNLAGTADPGNPQGYGGSHTGAALLYLLRCGSTDELARVQSLLTEHPILRHECCRSGDLDVEGYSDLWIHSFMQATPEERSQILAVIGVDVDETDDINQIVSKVRQHLIMKKVQGSMATNVSPTLSKSSVVEEGPKNESIIPDKMLPAFHYTMIGVALTVIFCLCGAFANFVYLRTLLARGRLDNVENSDKFLVVFIIGGISGVSAVWSWRHVKKKEK